MSWVKWIGAAVLLPVVGPSSILAAAAQAVVAKTVIDHTPAGSLANSFVDNVFRDKVVPKAGSILHCSLYGAEHTGVYVGDGLIVELLGTGEIRETTPREFIGGTNAMSIYVACNDDEPLWSPHVARRARLMAGGSRSYNLLLDNCHQFTCGCISGDFESSNNFFWMVEDVVSKEMNNGNSVTWRVWDLSTDELFG